MNNWHRLFEKNDFTISVNNIFPQVFYINLKIRKDRNLSMVKELSKYNIKAKRVCGTIKSEPSPHKINSGQLGCLLSHKKIIEQASQKHYDHILILEDDIVFKNTELKNIHNYWLSLPSDWDMFYLSGNNFMGLNKINNYIYKTNGTLSTGAYAIRQKAYNKILSILNSKIYDKPIDSYYAAMHHDMNAYVCVPSIAYQKPDFSNIENKFVDYSFLK
jgi:GR25 family glycosyltransferase involved in LPS biosynthesis